MLTEEQADALPAQALQAFLNHPLWARISNASRMHREWAFNMRQDIEGEVTLLQGVIDCCFIEDHQWVLVDYKTDRAEEERIIERHQKQVSLYAEALEQLTGIRVKERIIFAIALGKALTV
jgi:ATP-dependent helicase/nuclease subunit A